MDIKNILINKYNFCSGKAEIIESIYNRCNQRKLLDSRFMKELKDNEDKMKQRISELLLGDFLLSKGLPLDEGKDKGPDYMFSLEGRRYNVELITPVEIIIPENKNGMTHFHGRNVQAELQALHEGRLKHGEKYEEESNSPYDIFRLRLNESLKSKFNAYKGALKKGFVKKTDVNIICVNSSFSRVMAISPNGKDTMENILFGFGDIEINLLTREMKYGHENIITKIKSDGCRVPIDTRLFEVDNYDIISGAWHISFDDAFLGVASPNTPSYSSKVFRNPKALISISENDPFKLSVK